MKPFVTHIDVRFGHVDPAGIAYYPRIYEFIHQATEALWDVHVGKRYYYLVSEERLGFPLVHSEVDFKHPLRFGDTARIVMETTKLSSKSITNRYRIYLGDSKTLCAEVEIVTVPIDMDSFKARQVPEDVRVAFLNHLTGLTV